MQNPTEEQFLKAEQLLLRASADPSLTLCDDAWETAAIFLGRLSFVEKQLADTQTERNGLGDSLQEAEAGEQGAIYAAEQATARAVWLAEALDRYGHDADDYCRCCAVGDGAHESWCELELALSDTDSSWLADRLAAERAKGAAEALSVGRLAKGMQTVMQARIGTRAPLADFMPQAERLRAALLQDPEAPTPEETR
jgi:hypothetical protein